MSKESLPYRTIVSQVSTKDSLNAAAIRSFALHGYQATSMRSLAKACCINLSVVMHHCGSKLELLYKILDIINNYCQYELFSSLKNIQPSLKNRSQQFMERSQKFLTVFYESSLMPIVALELAGTEPKVKYETKLYFQNWTNSIVNLLSQHHYPENSAKLLAKRLSVEIQGAVLFDRVYKQGEHIDIVFQRLKQFIT